jgi:hypothetical protein
VKHNGAEVLSFTQLMQLTIWLNSVESSVSQPRRTAAELGIAFTTGNLEVALSDPFCYPA